MASRATSPKKKENTKAKLKRLILSLERDILTHNPNECDSCFTTRFIIRKLKRLVK